MLNGSLTELPIKLVLILNFNIMNKKSERSVVSRAIQSVDGFSRVFNSFSFPQPYAPTHRHPSKTSRFLHRNFLYSTLVERRSCKRECSSTKASLLGRADLSITSWPLVVYGDFMSWELAIFIYATIDIGLFPFFFWMHDWLLYLLYRFNQVQFNNFPVFLTQTDWIKINISIFKTTEVSNNLLFIMWIWMTFFM